MKLLMSVKTYINTFTIGLFLFTLFIVQFVFELKWEWLYALQQQETYKRWSGLVLAIFIVFQWLLSIFRVTSKLRKYSIKMLDAHKWLGAFSLVFFYFHSMTLGYAYLAFLSSLFIINMLLGTINLDIIKNQKDWVFKLWMVAHVAFSIIITCIMLLHIGVVFYYK